MVRFKNRYFTIEVIPKKESKPLVLKTSTLQAAIQKEVQNTYGQKGLSTISTGFNAKYCNTHTKIALIRCRHGPHNYLISTIPKVIDIGGTTVSIKILYVGATMKKCFAFIRKYQTKKLESMWASLKNDNERKKMIDALMTLTPAMKNFQ
ncbi:Similar to POP5: Ribonuclease P/MRP protein subunit POP5 (Bos taurus) [Cotesia congregata]|uniref:Ribonuclease P/MRP protein subunit POP5 n=1 Tax=Cotesia congregata TaxID=51543 RepID=A0A8J2HAA0_COTCN|nr:Similar to POP5: Ribonuclease P/MRP protein subunit POP5 (Bos taurus) [Cotesia congregata]